MMGNPKASPVAPLNPIARSGSIESAAEPIPEQTRDFHFAVTWVTLFAHLDPIEASGPRRRPENASLALVPVVASAALVEQRVNQDTAAWEMVVPKMIRTENGDFSPDDSGKPRLL
jgi:hypothetical protein